MHRGYAVATSHEAMQDVGVFDMFAAKRYLCTVIRCWLYIHIHVCMSSLNKYTSIMV